MVGVVVNACDVLRLVIEEECLLLVKAHFMTNRLPSVKHDAHCSQNANAQLAAHEAESRSCVAALAASKFEADSLRALLKRR